MSEPQKITKKIEEAFQKKRENKSNSSRFGGENAQRQLLEEEGVRFLDNGKVNMRECRIIV